MYFHVRDTIYFLQANIGMWKDCESALHRLRGENADISEEAIEIKVTY